MGGLRRQGIDGLNRAIFQPNPILARCGRRSKPIQQRQKAAGSSTLPGRYVSARPTSSPKKYAHS